MLNRAALILRYRQPAIDWVNRVDATDHTSTVTQDDVDRDRTVYLIPAGGADSDEEFSDWLLDNYEQLFDNETESWYLDETLWPTLTGIGMFHEWFDLEILSVVVDMADAELEDDDYDE